MITKIRVCLPTSNIPYENLALEEYLMKTARPGECIMSLWRNKRTVVIGRNQNARLECRADDLTADGGHLARRFSGGGAVFHDLGNLNFSFLVRDPDYDVDRQLSVIQLALKRFGLNAEKTGRNDVAVDGRKCSGNAFLREGAARCHHGTLLISVSSAHMVKYLTPDPAKLAAKGVKSVPSRVVNLHDICEALTVETVIPTLIAAFEEVYGLKSDIIPLESLDWAAVNQRAAFLADPAWIFGKDPVYNLHSGRHRFGWGGAQLFLAEEEGKIRQAGLFTDAMDEGLSARVAAAMEGKNANETALLTALSAAHLDAEIEADLAGLICEVF